MFEKIFSIFNIPFGYLIRWFNDITGNYMLALLLFAIVVKLVLAPISIKQQKGQIKQAQMRPLEMAIRNKYKGRTDKVTQQKMQNEILDLYQKQGYSPLSGCLPLLIQFPVIISLYQIIRKPLTYICRISAEGLGTIVNRLNEWTGSATFDVAKTQEIDIVSAVRGLTDAQSASLSAEVENLSQISKLDFTVFGGLDLSAMPSFQNPSWLLLIPLLTFVTSFLGMKISRKFMPQQGAAAAAGGDAGASMKIMDFTMPLMSVFFTFMFSGTIGVYWIYQNVLSAVQTVILAKLMPLPRFSEEDYKAAERQLAGKTPKKRELDPDRPKPRSLHHIDDDEDETEPTPPKKSNGTNETDKPDDSFGESSFYDAPRLKDDKNSEYKKKKK